MPDILPVSMLIDALCDKNLSSRIRVKENLVACGSAAVEPLIALLASGTACQAADAITILGKIGDDRAVDPLLRVLSGPNLLFRISAAQALGGLKSSRAVEGLMKALDVADESEAVLTYLLNSLGKIGDQAAVCPLIAFLGRTSSSQLRYMTIKVLGELRDGRAIEAIVPYLADGDQHVRGYAREALIKLGCAQLAPDDGAS